MIFNSVLDREGRGRERRKRRRWGGGKRRERRGRRVGGSKRTRKKKKRPIFRNLAAGDTTLIRLFGNKACYMLFLCVS